MYIEIFFYRYILLNNAMSTLTEQLILALFANGITTMIFYKFYNKFFLNNNTITEKLDYILNKIKNLESEVNDLHETLEDFETQFVEKDFENKILRDSNIDLQERHSKLKNNLSNYIISDYDLIH
jgi:predicted nuclease with TOPRIM domain